MKKILKLSHMMKFKIYMQHPKNNPESKNTNHDVLDIYP